MEDKWICNKCDNITYEKPENKNATCKVCNKGRYKIIRTCECGSEFHPDRYTKKYCSVECGYKYRKAGGKKGKTYPHTQRARIATCEVCSKEFRAVDEHKGRISKYCSKDCWSIRATMVNECKYCNKEIVTSKSVDQQYCNQKCRNLHYREILKGENSHFWKGGKTKESKIRRTSAEYKEWRMAVFKRDNFTCQECGSKKELEAHHIKEQSNYPELIYDIDNGLTLCHECHKQTDNYGYKVNVRC